MIRKSVLLPCPQPRAFTLFTARISEWWPADRRHTRDPQSELFLTEGGRFWERARDGHEVDLGRVREWLAPERLLLDFYVGTDAAHPTEVEVSFVPEGAGTRVSITHRPTALSEEMWKLRNSAFDRSWDVVLAALATAAAAEPG